MPSACDSPSIVFPVVHSGEDLSSWTYISISAQEVILVNVFNG